MRLGLGLATAMMLSTGMGVGSLHNAQMRDALPGFFTPIGFALIALTLIGFFAAMWIAFHFVVPERAARRWATAGAIFLVVIELLNLVSTLGAEGTISGWLFHEYLGVLVAPILLVFLLRNKTEGARAA